MAKLFAKAHLTPSIILAILIAFFSANSTADCKLVIRVNDNPPQYIQENGKWTGRAVELMETLLSEAGCIPEYKKMPWARAILELEKGTIDGMMNVGYNQDRAQHFYYISPHTFETTVLIVKKDSDFKINSLDDLKLLSFPIGYEKGNIFDQTFTKKTILDEAFREKFQASPTGNLAEMVVRDRLSGQLEIRETAYYLLENNKAYAASLKVHPLQISKLPTYLAFSRKSVSKDLLLKLHQANIRAIAKESYKDVVDKWER